VELRPLRIVSATHLGLEIPRPHTRHAHDLTTERGERWVAKSTRTIQASGLRAEAVAALVAQVIGAPVPEGAVCDIGGVRWWCSSWLASADPWSRARSRDLNAAGDCARIVLLDLLIGNEDRHRDNLLLARLDSGARRVVAIDHEQAWVGHAGGLDTARLPDLHKYPEDFAEHLDVTNPLVTCAELAATTPAKAWPQVAAGAAAVAPGIAQDRLAGGLHGRASMLPTLATCVPARA
jgi:hypothetical protein